MASLEKFFCLFALLLAVLMSSVLCVVVCSVPAPRPAAARAPQAAASLVQREPDLHPRAPSESFLAPASGGQP
jgi:hypothetical protein